MSSTVQETTALKTPTLSFTDAERNSGCMEDDNLLRAYYLYRTHGYLLLENVFPADYIHKMRESYMERYRSYMEYKDHPDALLIGHKRFMITVVIEPPFNDPYLYANPLVLPILHCLLGPNCTIGGFGSVASLPGSEEQHSHRDFPTLFDDYALDVLMPSFTVTVIVPMIEMNALHGTTRMYPASMRIPDVKAKTLPFDEPVAPVGSVLLFDFKMKHCGTANLSQEVRPILYNLYCRPWFMDSENYSKQPPLVMTEEEYQRIPDEHKGLFRLATTQDGRLLAFKSVRHTSSR